MTARRGKRPPKAFRPDDPKVRVREAEPVEPPLATPEGGVPARTVEARTLERGARWGTILLWALGGLVGLAAGLWLDALVRDLLGRQDWIGWLALGLLGLAALAGAMVVVRELWALARLARIGRLRSQAERAIAREDKEAAETAVKDLKRLYHGRAELAWAKARLAEHEGDILDAGELLTLAERELVAPLDAQAQAIVAASAKRVSVLTAVSPAALIDMIFVAAENLRMLRRLATLYGARPGGLGLVRLARMVITHIVVTGGIAVGDDLLQQLIGQGLTARLSTRLGEGLFNGALTARIGVAAIDVCRPLPFIAAPRPRFRDLVAKAAGLGGKVEET